MRFIEMLSYSLISDSLGIFLGSLWDLMGCYWILRDCLSFNEALRNSWRVYGTVWDFMDCLGFLEIPLTVEGCPGKVSERSWRMRGMSRLPGCSSEILGILHGS